MKIAIIGHSGGGKSTLAQALAKHYHVPKLHLDQLYFLPNWQPRPQEQFAVDLQSFLTKNTDWVIDGVYSKFLFRERLEQADSIIFLNFSRLSSLSRIWKRRYSKSQVFFPRGCPKTFSWNFLYFALFYSRRKERQVMYEEICQNYSNKIIIICNQKELDSLYQHLKNEANLY